MLHYAWASGTITATTKNDNKINKFRPQRGKKKKKKNQSQSHSHNSRKIKKIKKPKPLTQQHVLCISEEVSINIAYIK